LSNNGVGWFLRASLTCIYHIAAAKTGVNMSCYREFSADDEALSIGDVVAQEQNLASEGEAAIVLGIPSTLRWIVMPLV
jgi:hypothetical protein